MSDWQERITMETEPTIRLEHVMRYRFAAPLIKDSALWCDLGCGTGTAVEEALGGRFEGRAMLVDVNAEAVELASREVPADDLDTLTADLSSREEVDRVRAALLDTEVNGERCLTCFETVEHLGNFVPLLGLLLELSQNEEFTVVLSVPNDAFGAIQNPYHLATWGEASLDELRRLLPMDHVLVHQLQLGGSALVPADAGAHRRESQVELDPARVPTHFLAAFGPRARELEPVVGLAQLDLNDRLLWERQRESHLAYAERELSDFRDYIHELERRLGLPPSGTDGSGQRG